GDPPGVAGRHQPGHGRGRDEADRRLDGPGGGLPRRRHRHGGRRRGAGNDPEVPGAGHLRLTGQGRSSGEDHMAKASRKLFISAGLTVAVGLLATTAHAEVIELLDKTKMTGKVIHYYDGVYTIEA